MKSPNNETNTKLQSTLNGVVTSLRRKLSTSHTPKCSLTLYPTFNGKFITQSTSQSNGCTVDASLTRGDSNNTDFQDKFQHSNRDLAKVIEDHLKDWYRGGAKSVHELRLEAGRSAKSVLRQWTAARPNPHVSGLTWAEPRIVMMVLDEGETEFVEVVEPASG